MGGPGSQQQADIAAGPRLMGFGWSRGTAGSGLLGTEELWRGTAGTLSSPVAVEEGSAGSVGHVLPVLCPGRYSCGSLGMQGMRI